VIGNNLRADGHRRYSGSACLLWLLCN
jgi:hypothetical protein